MRTLAAVLVLVSLCPAVRIAGADESRESLVRRLHSLDGQVSQAARQEFEALDRPAREQVAARVVQALQRGEHRSGENSPDAVLEALGASAVPALSGLLADPRSKTRVSAVSVLGMIARREPLPEAAAAVVPLLERALDDDHREVLLAAVGMLSSLGARHARATAPALERLLADPDPLVRSQAAAALARIDVDRLAPIPILLGDLQHRNEHVRIGAAYSLGLFGRRAASAVPALTRALNDPDAAVRLRVAEALVRIDPAVPGIVPTLAALLDDPHPGVRSAAGQALEPLGPAAAGAVPALVKALGDPDSNVRLVAVMVLRNIGPPARAALEQAAKSGDRAVAATAAEALRRIGER